MTRRRLREADAPPLSSALVRRLLFTHLAVAGVLFLCSIVLVVVIDVLRFTEDADAGLSRDLAEARGPVAREVLLGDALGRQAVVSHFRESLALDELRLLDAPAGQVACEPFLARVRRAEGASVAFDACASVPLSDYATDRVLVARRAEIHSGDREGFLLVGSHAATFVVSALLLLVSLRRALARWFVEPLADLSRYLTEKATSVWHPTPDAPLAPALAPTSEFRGLLRSLEGIEETFRRERRAHEALQEERVVFRTLQEEALMLAHDLRQPSLAAAAFVSLLEEARDAEGVREVVASHAPKVREALARLDRGLEDLLAIGAPRVVEGGAVDLRAAVEHAAHGVPNLRAQGGLRIEVPDDLAIWGDADRLGRVLWNLFKNAAQARAAAGRGEPIVVRAGRRANTAWIAVENHGTPLPAEIAAHAFEPFRTVGPHKGTGLGLSIVRRFVRQHGGDVRIDADGHDGGPVRFVIEGLTLANDAVPSPGSIEAGRIVDADAAPSTSPDPGPKVRRFVLVEDNPIFRQAWRNILDSRGEILAFSRTEDARAYLQGLDHGERDATAVITDLFLQESGAPGPGRGHGDALRRGASASDAHEALEFLRWLRARTGGVVAVCTSLDGKGLDEILPPEVTRVRKSLPAMRDFAERLGQV